IKLNAAPYAIPFYHAIGFTDIGAESIYQGIRYTPMELQL
ncbi:MAG: GNAT family N-acetyltransferase, partial [Lachnospiraceae bacterium]|nr:GNAT family N-acetyltransferase [Lachnospiraceae bacterium]